MTMMNKGMGSVRLRPLRKEDFTGMHKLLSTREELDERGGRVRAELMQWLALHNPFAGDDPTYYVAEQNGEVVGFHGRMPVIFSVNGEKHRGYYVHDLYVHPDAREKGLGFWITMALAKEIEDRTESFFCLVGMTDLNRLMQRRRGYHEQSADLYVRAIGFRNEFARKIGTGLHNTIVSAFPRTALAFADLFLLRLPGSLSVAPLTRFDAEAEKLFERLAPKMGICIWKSAEYMNWRYFDRPYPRERVYSVRENGSLAGYVVVSDSPYRKRFKRGVIVDLVADPDRPDVISALAKQALRHFRKRGVDSVGCTFTDDRFAAPLRKLLFVRGTGGKLVMLGNLKAMPEHEPILSNIKRWHLTFGESDGFMLSP